MTPRSELNLIPGMGFALMIMLIVVAFQVSFGPPIALPVAAHADLGPPDTNEIVLRLYAKGLMELSIDDEWGNRWSGYYRQPRTIADLERELRRLYAERTQDRVLVLKADTATAGSVIQQVMVAARDAGVRVITAVVDEKMAR